MLTKDGLSALLRVFAATKADRLSTVRGKKAWQVGADAKTVKRAACENLMIIMVDRFVRKECFSFWVRNRSIYFLVPTDRSFSRG